MPESIPASSIASHGGRLEAEKPSSPSISEKWAELSKEKAVPSRAVFGPIGLPIGASLTGVTSKLIVFASASMSVPPLSVPPSSMTRKVKEASAAPYASAGGVQTSRSSLSASIVAPEATASPASVSVPASGSVTIRTACSRSPSRSLKPKSGAEKPCAPSSATVIVRSVPDGAWFTSKTVSSKSSE